MHRGTLARQTEAKRQQAEHAHKEAMIKEARAEYQRRKAAGSGPGMRS